MKFKQSLLAVSILAASQSYAAPVSYNVSGALAGVNTMGATVNPTLWVHAGVTSYSTSAAVWPTFTSSWAIDYNPSTPGAYTITGNFGTFAQYSTSIKASIFGTAVVNQPNAVYAFNTGTVNYNPTTRTLTLGQAMSYSDTDSNTLNVQTSDGTLSFTGAAGGCTGASVICSGQSIWFLSYPDMERFYLVLTFDSTFTGFSGTAVGADVGGPLPLGTTGNTWYKYEFTGELPPPPPVPVPAAAWLFGSGLAGLAGVARRRRARLAGKGLV